MNTLTMINPTKIPGCNCLDGDHPRLNVLVLYDHSATFTNMVREHLESFSRYSRHRFFYAAAAVSNLDPPTQVDLTPFDVLIIHYSIRLCFNQMLPVFGKAVENFRGLKVLFIQDEYDNTESERQWITRLGVHVVFTCVPQPYINQVYPQARFPSVEFINVLTGYVPLEFEAFSHKPIYQRKYFIGYRGRPPLFRYGDLTREKWTIGCRMREICAERSIDVSIELENEQRIYGEAWYEFLQDCRATLGTESGSNVFDDDGSIQRAVDRALSRDPGISYDTVHAEYLLRYEGKILMNQISPRVFEAISLKTALVLFQGEYSGIIKPDIHYIPLRKDFNNVDEVLAKLSDDGFLQTMIERAYEDIVQSRVYSYQNFVEMVSTVISERVVQENGARSLSQACSRSSVPVPDARRLRPADMANLPSLFTMNLLAPDAINPPLTVRHVAKLMGRGNFQTARKYLANALLCYPTAHKLIGGMKRVVRRLFLPLRRSHT